MEPKIYFEHMEPFILGFSGPPSWPELHPHNFIDVMYCSEKEDDKDQKISSFLWINYKQELAIANGINLTHLPDIALQPTKESLLELDYSNISQETIDEIGDSSNLNIAIIFYFVIDTAYNNKKMFVEVMKKFIEYMKGKCGYIITKRDSPMKYNDSEYVIEGMKVDGMEDDYEKAQYKLHALWQQCGFKQFKNYDNVFICNVNKTVSHLLKSKTSAI